MHATSRYGLRIPDGTDSDNPPLHIGYLASDVEGRLAPLDDRTVTTHVRQHMNGGQFFASGAATPVTATTTDSITGPIDSDGTDFIVKPGGRGVYVAQASVSCLDINGSAFTFNVRYEWLINGAPWEAGGHVGFTEPGYGGIYHGTSQMQLLEGDRVRLRINPRGISVQSRGEAWGQTKAIVRIGGI